MDVSPAVAASTTPNTMMAAIHTVVAISESPPFRNRPMMPARAATPSSTPAASHLFLGDRFVRNAVNAPCSVGRGRSGAFAVSAASAAAPTGTSSANSVSSVTW